jgi:ligand-binding sensor domain-containing protein/signal transduction histidine kinase
MQVPRPQRCRRCFFVEQSHSFVFRVIWVLLLSAGFGVRADDSQPVPPSDVPQESGWTNFYGFSSISWASNRIDVFARGQDESLQHRVYDGSWHEWQSLGGIITSKPAVCSWGEGRIDVFARGADDALWHRTFADGYWHGWEPLGGKLTAGPSIVECRENYIDIHVRGINNTRQRLVWDGGWSDWETLEAERSVYANTWFLDRLLHDKNIVRHNARAWRIDDGLPHNSVQAIVQTRDGFLWIGTFNGLARFDGVRFTPIEISGFERSKGPSVTALCEADDGSLWIGTDGNGLIRLHHGEFQHYRQAHGLSDDRVRVLFQARDSSLWIGTSQGLTFGKDGKFRAITEDTGLSRNVVRAIREDDSGQLWIATSIGLNCIRNGAVVSSYTNLPDLSLRSLCFDRQGKLWVGSSGGVFRFDENINLHFKKANGLPDNFVSALFEDRRGTLWIGTYSGLCRPVDGTLSATQPVDAKNSFLTELDADRSAYDQVNAIYEDREGNLWIGAKDGLHRLKAGPFTTCSAREGLSHNNVLSLLQDKSGSLWVATWGGGLNRLRNGSFASFNAMMGLTSDQLLSLCEDHEGALWVGADFNGGLYRWQYGRFTQYNRDNGFDNLAVRVIYEDRYFNLWIGTSSGLNLFNDGQFIRYTMTNDLPGNIVRALREDREGNLWIGTDGGLCKTSAEHLKAQRAAKKMEVNAPNAATRPATVEMQFQTSDVPIKEGVLAIHEDAEGSLWIGTPGGLYRVGKHGTSIYTSEDGLFADEIYDILEDDSRNLWMSTRKGIFRVNKQAFDDFDARKSNRITSVAYGRGDGMESVQCNGVSKPAAWKSTDGRLWFATTRGFVVINPETIESSQTLQSPVVIEKVIADKKRIQEEGTENSRTKNKGPRFSIPPGRGELEFHYTSLSFATPEKSQFRYKLEGFDNEWVDSGTRRIAYYNNLPPGSYVFRVLACNGDGVWSSPGASVKLRLLPHFWQTWWFKSFAVMASLSVVGAGARFTTKQRMQRALERLEQQNVIEKERARIAQDMHDELGARLTEIMFLSGTMENRQTDSDVKPVVGKITHAARDVVQNLDAIVWAVNPGNDTLENLIHYIHDYMERFLGVQSVRCRFEVPKQMPSCPVNSEVRHNLFLVVKEALNNLVKHSGASEAKLRVILNNHNLVLSIEDNGRGFIVESVSKHRNGLQNIRKRMERIGGLFTLASEPGNGTRIRLEVPMKH